MAAAAGLGLGLLGTAGKTVSNVLAADTQAKVDENKALNAEQNAQQQEIQSRRQFKFATGEANAIGAASGLDLTQGSPLKMELDRTKQAEIQALSIRRAGATEAQGYRFDARMARRSIPGSIIQGLAGGGSILTRYVGSG
jgi:hypothetical protein